MSRRQQLMRPHQSVLLPPEVPVFWIETNSPGQVEYYVDANPGTTPTLYRIQYSTTATFDEGTVQEITTASTGYQSLYLPPGVEYYFQARAERDDLTSSWTGVTGGTVPALFVEQTGADSDYAYANWSTIPLAEGYSYDIDGGGFNFTTDISLSVACAPGQTLTLTVIARLGADYGNPTTITLVGLPVAPTVSLDLGDRGGAVSLEYSVAQAVYYTQFDWSLGYYDISSSFVEILSGTFYENTASYILADDYPELTGTTVEFRAFARYIVDSLDLTSEMAFATYGYIV